MRKMKTQLIERDNLATAGEDEVNNHWLKHETYVHNLLASRDKISEDMEALINPDRFKSFESYWKDRYTMFRIRAFL